MEFIARRARAGGHEPCPVGWRQWMLSCAWLSPCWPYWASGIPAQHQHVREQQANDHIARSSQLQTKLCTLEGKHGMDNDRFNTAVIQRAISECGAESATHNVRLPRLVEQMQHIKAGRTLGDGLKGHGCVSDGEQRRH
eukprot:3036059-Rhodomonas_salina.2